MTTERSVRDDASSRSRTRIHMDLLDNLQSDSIYKKSLYRSQQGFILMCCHDGKDRLCIQGSLADDFFGEYVENEFGRVKIAPLNHANAKSLRKHVPYTSPIPILAYDRTIGLGDRLGIAGFGHLQAIKNHDVYPILAQQSMRELNMTRRTYEDVLDAASFAVFKAGYKKGFGADGDHLRTPEEIESALKIGYTMITLDCSDYIKQESDLDLRADMPQDFKDRYLGQTISIEDHVLKIEQAGLRRAYAIYGEAIDYTEKIYEQFFSSRDKRANFELSIDETATPTTPLDHYVIASELDRRGVRLDTLAPRFIGEFQKGIDYIGDIDTFETDFAIHAAIARRFGYKLSIHSGSDKFSIFRMIGQQTRGRYHVKTAGTNWLEAMRLIALKDPGLYRKIHAFSIDSFADAQKLYHVTTNLSNIPALDTLSDDQLVALFENDDARQLLHITYGHILNALNEDGTYRFKDDLDRLWNRYRMDYHDMLAAHIRRHLVQLENNH